MAPTRTLVWDLCPFGLPEISTVAHIKKTLPPGIEESVPTSTMRKAPDLGRGVNQHGHDGLVMTCEVNIIIGNERM